MTSSGLFVEPEEVDRTLIRLLWGFPNDDFSTLRAEVRFKQVFLGEAAVGFVDADLWESLAPGQDPVLVSVELDGADGGWDFDGFHDFTF